MYVADNGTLQVKPTYIFWCVTDFSVSPHGQMLGIVQECVIDLLIMFSYNL